MPVRSLNPRQRRFVREYLSDLNGKRAVLRSGYQVSEKSAEVYAARLLGNVRVRLDIDDALLARARRLEIKADAVVRELARISFVDIREAFDASGRPKPLRDIPEDIRRAIASYEVDSDGRCTIRFWSKTKALDLLCRHLGVYAEKSRGIDGTTLEQLIDAASAVGFGSTTEKAASATTGGSEAEEIALEPRPLLLGPMK